MCGQDPEHHATLHLGVFRKKDAAPAVAAPAVAAERIDQPVLAQVETGLSSDKLLDLPLSQILLLNQTTSQDFDIGNGSVRLADLLELVRRQQCAPLENGQQSFGRFDPVQLNSLSHTAQCVCYNPITYCINYNIQIRFPTRCSRFSRGIPLFASHSIPSLLGTAGSALLGFSLVFLPVGAYAADLEAADQLRWTGKYAEAEEIYLSQKDGWPVEAVLGLARCHAARGKYDEAEHALNEAADSQATVAVLRSELAVLAFRRGDYEAAGRHADASLSLDDDQFAARWIVAELHRVSGRLEEAEKAYRWFVEYPTPADQIDEPESLMWIGRATAQLARWNRPSRGYDYMVNRLYPRVLQLNKHYWPAHLERALLLLEKFNQEHATDSLNAALEINMNAPEVHAARARMALQNHQLDVANDALDQAQAINQNLIVAHQLRADALLANLQARQAVTRLESTVELNKFNEETLGRLAAAYGAVDGLRLDPRNTRMGRLIDEVTDRNEHCGRFFATLGESLDTLRKYPHAAKYYQEAMQRMPQLVSVLRNLGMMYMRLGRENEAARLLEKSFRIDRANVRVKNSLEVLDLLNSYAVIETDHFIIRFDRGADEILARCAARYLEKEVYPDIVASMGFEPPEKSLFEIFNRAGGHSGHSWFSARMVGLPYIGTVGACAGKVVALASPNDMPSKYNWARVLKHEFVHVVNLQQTDFNIPHWFTEALAVGSEGYPLPSAWVQLLATRLASDRLYNLDTINLGFIRPANGDDWTLAYCQSRLYADFIVKSFGPNSLTKMLDAYAENQTTRAALQSALSIDQEAFEQAYLKFIHAVMKQHRVTQTGERKSFAELRDAVIGNPRDGELAAQLAFAFLQRNAHPQARRLVMAARRLEPQNQLASYVLASLHGSIGDTNKALDILVDTLDEDNPQENHLELLAGLLLRSDRQDEAIQMYELGTSRFPVNIRWREHLIRAYRKVKNSDKLMKLLQQQAKLDADNPAIRKELAQLAQERNDFERAAEWANLALEIDVMDAESHAMLGIALARTGQVDRALEHYEFSVRLRPEALRWRYELAEVCVDAGKLEQAGEVLDALCKFNPDYPDAAKLREQIGR